jgi:hypothetical protein
MTRVKKAQKGLHMAIKADDLQRCTLCRQSVVIFWDGWIYVNNKDDDIQCCWASSTSNVYSFCGDNFAVNYSGPDIAAKHYTIWSTLSARVVENGSHFICLLYKKNFLDKKKKDGFFLQQSQGTKCFFTQVTSEAEIVQLSAQAELQTSL